MVITQEGKLTVVPQESQSKMTLVADRPEPTNAPGVGADPARK